MKPQDAERFTQIACDAAQAAAQVAAQGFRTGARIDRKTGTELVTRFDFAAEDRLREVLATLTPDIPVVAEERGGDRSAERLWYADPIDGTTNFAHGHPVWCTAVGLVVRGVAVAGAVVAPALHLTWTGWLGGPALRNGEPCRVSSTAALADALVATGFPYDRQTNPDNNLDAFAAMQKVAVGVRRCGSAAIDLCLVSDGAYDGYWERKLRPWDIAAGVAIVHAAGGRVSSMANERPDLQSGQVVASNGQIHDALLAALRSGRGGRVD